MHFLKVSLYLAATSYYCVVSAGATVAPLYKSKEEQAGQEETPLVAADGGAVQSVVPHNAASSSEQQHVPPQVKSFTAQKESRHDISKFLSKYVKDTVLSEFLVGTDSKNKGAGWKGKVARFLFNQKKNKMLNKMKKSTSNMNAKTKEQVINVNDSSRRTNQLTDTLFPWMKAKLPFEQSSPDVKQASVKAADQDDYYYYTPPTSIFDILDILDELSMLVTGMDQTAYTEVAEGLTSLIDSTTNIPSPEEFCADFDVTTIQEECVGATSALTTLIQGAIHAPWLLRDIVGYIDVVVREIASWETFKGLVSGIMSMYGADGTIDGALVALRGAVVDFFEFLISFVDPYYGYYYPVDDVGGLIFDILPLAEATAQLSWGSNYFLDESFITGLWYTVSDIGGNFDYFLGGGYIEVPEFPVFHADLCQALGLVPANVNLVTSCDYFEDIGQVPITTKGVEFCVKTAQDITDYSAELVSMESTFDIDTLQEANMDWIIDELQQKSWKYDNFNFTALESMTCSLKAYLLAPSLICNEKPLNTFLWKDGQEMTCKKLRKTKTNRMKKICNDYDTARYACPSTCCMCDEDPMATFFRRYVEEDGVKVPEMKTCKWLSKRSPKNLDKFCYKNFAPPGLKVASGVCPVTCGFCEAPRDNCQEAIDNFFATTTSLEWYNSSAFEKESVYWYDYVNVSYMFYSNQYVMSTYLGSSQGRVENKLIFDDGSFCEENTRYSGKLIVEGTTELGMNGTYFSKSSPCSYEFKEVIFCGDNNSTNSTSFWLGRNLFRTVVEYFYPRPEDEILDWQK